ncbi:uncharacterized protein RJT20DRAFT_136009 [Scheffersomyces xylosifermentans]|uniref:uncharacterized protein n=1 Tax=Scheffersomyces xylosifermentans TaxID=1304137 RepID=UPI00315CF234
MQISYCLVYAIQLAAIANALPTAQNDSNTPESNNNKMVKRMLAPNQSGGEPGTGPNATDPRLRPDPAAPADSFESDTSAVSTSTATSNSTTNSFHPTSTSNAASSPINQTGYFVVAIAALCNLL